MNRINLSIYRIYRSYNRSEYIYRSIILNANFVVISIAFFVPMKFKIVIIIESLEAALIQSNKY